MLLWGAPCPVATTYHTCLCCTDLEGEAISRGVRDEACQEGDAPATTECDCWASRCSGLHIRQAPHAQAGMMKEKKIPRMSHVILLNLKRVPSPGSGKMMPECECFLADACDPSSTCSLALGLGPCDVTDVALAQVGRYRRCGMRSSEHAAGGDVAGGSMCASCTRRSD